MSSSYDLKPSIFGKFITLQYSSEFSSSSFMSFFVVKTIRWGKNYLLSILDGHLIHYPSPINLTYAWSFGSSAGICLVIYSILLRGCTILEPQTHKYRFQIGFGKCDWSLTKTGLARKQAKPDATVLHWMLEEGAFTQGGPSIIWKGWSIVLSGVLMLLTYFSTFILWTIGFALLAKHGAKKKEGPPRW